MFLLFFGICLTLVGAALWVRAITNYDLELIFYSYGVLIAGGCFTVSAILYKVFS